MKVKVEDFNTKEKNTWCPGCGNFAIHHSLKQAFVDLNLSPSEVVLVFDIGCNGNGADDIEGFRIKGLHGRSIALASGAYLANSKMKVVADIGDGGVLHEGIDHLIHAIRSNYDIMVLIHNNQNFALTTGQATATTREKKPIYAFPDGKPEGSINIGELVLSLNPTFFARGYSGDPKQLTEIMKEAIVHKGLSVVEIMQICPTFNKEANSEWFSSRIAHTTAKQTISEAVAVVKDTEKIYTGVIYQNRNRPDFLNSLENRKKKKTELVDEVKNYDIKNILSRFQ
ncbi:MAG: thiamine pyrophosphate-dependent enzyme [Candidatus Dojkabacteria bacterium]